MTEKLPLPASDAGDDPLHDNDAWISDDDGRGGYGYVVYFRHGGMPARAFDTDPLEVIEEAFAKAVSAGPGAVLGFSGLPDTRTGSGIFRADEIAGIRYILEEEIPAQDVGERLQAALNGIAAIAQAPPQRAPAMARQLLQALGEGDASAEKAGMGDAPLLR